MDYETVLDFWFEYLTPNQWWGKDNTLDNTIKKKFGDLHQQGILGELHNWREEAEGALAEVVVLDQFSRNIHRNTSRSFANDGMALILSQVAIKRAFNLQLSPMKRLFLYMPFMHSESVVIHKQAQTLFSEPGLESNLEFEMKHAAIIERFNRYPHRNAILGRASSPAEIEFLKTHSGF